MAEKRKWMARAFAHNKGAFGRQAKAAGESTKEFAQEKASASGKTGKRARLALIGMKYGGGAKKQSKALRSKK